MRYYVTLDREPQREPIAVDVQELPDGALQVHVGGRRVSVDVIAALDSLSISIDGKIVDLTTEGTPPDLGVVANGHRAYVNVESERQRAAAQAKRGSRGPGDKVALAPMPGRIIRVRVQAGDTITQGQPLVVMEAMKMENEIRAKTAGIVASVHVATGDTVESGAQLVKFS